MSLGHDESADFIGFCGIRDLKDCHLSLWLFKSLCTAEFVVIECHTI